MAIKAKIKIAKMIKYTIFAAKQSSKYLQFVSISKRKLFNFSNILSLFKKNKTKIVS